jgi:hypothetical protein
LYSQVFSAIHFAELSDVSVEAKYLTSIPGRLTTYAHVTSSSPKATAELKDNRAAAVKRIAFM